jgi:hypothetical protein
MKFSGGFSLNSSKQSYEMRTDYPSTLFLELLFDNLIPIFSSLFSLDEI